jgi:hypothetical protein
MGVVVCAALFWSSVPNPAIVTFSCLCARAVPVVLRAEAKLRGWGGGRGVTGRGGASSAIGNLSRGGVSLTCPLQRVPGN